MNITVSRRLLAKLAAARDALSHSNPGASEEEILEVGLDLILQRHAKRRGIGAKPRKSTGTTKTPALPPSQAGESAPPAPAPRPSAPAQRSCHVPAQIAREVWERDEGRCQWSIDGGEICGETYQVQVDHIPGFALGAGHTPDQLRLLCRMHQDVHARRLYGDDLMDKYARPKGGGCSEPVAEYAAGRRPSTCDGGGATAERSGASAGRERAGRSLLGPRERPRSLDRCSARTSPNAMWAGPRGRASRAKHRLGRSLSFDAYPAQAARSAPPHRNLGEVFGRAVASTA